MAITKQSIEAVADQVKNFFKNFLNPNMKIEDIADVVSTRLDPIIIANEEKGLHYSAGKFYIKAADDKHFQLEFEIFFKDDDDKWHKLSNQSELRDISLLEEGAAKTLQKLKVIEFPISAPEITPAVIAEKKTAELAAAEDNKSVEEKFDELTGVKPETDGVKLEK